MYDVIFTKRDWTEERALSCRERGLAVAIARVTLKSRPSELLRALVIPCLPEEGRGEFDDGHE